MFADVVSLRVVASLARGCARLGALGFLAGAPLQAQVLVDFELAGPCSFSSTQPLRDEYAFLGVHFRGPTPVDGGAVLDTCGNFGISPHSGVDFLAFNHGSSTGSGSANDPEEMLFDQRILQASIWASAVPPTDFLLEAYDGLQIVDTQLMPSVTSWTQITVSAPGGFTRLVIDGNTPIFVLDDLSFDPQVIVTYCTGKVNSLGCLPAMGSNGSSSASATSGFHLRATNVRNQKQGLLFYGVSGRAAIPFQGGTLCIASPVKRTPAVNSGGTPVPAADCSGIYSLDMNAFASGNLGGHPLPALLVPGTVVDCQFWGRDPGFPPPNGTALTNALEYGVGP